MRRLFPFIFFLAVLCACNGPDPAADVFQAPEILDISAEKGEDYSLLVLTCRVSSGNGIKSCGFYFGEDFLSKITSPTPIQDNKFTLTVTDLEYSSEYKYKAFIDGGRVEVVSDLKTWQTEDEIPPAAEILAIDPAYGAEAGKVTISLVVPDFASIAGKESFECGICYGPDGAEPNINSSLKQAERSPNGFYSLVIEGLSKSSDYCFRPYTKIRSKLIYGESVSERIPSGAEAVLTIGYSDLTPQSVKLKGYLNPELGEARCSFEMNGTIYMATSIDDSGYFYLSLSNLNADTDYSFRAVAQVGTMKFYGEFVSFNSGHEEEGNDDEEEDWDNTNDFLIDDLFGTWVGDIICSLAGVYFPSAFTITFGASDDLLAGDIIVTEFMGYEGTGTGYMEFNTTTGALSIPDNTPIAKVNSSYYLGMCDVNGDGNGYFVFRYDPKAKTLSPKDIKFVGFEGYKASDFSASGLYGYCYCQSEGNKFFLSKKENYFSESTSISLTKDSVQHNYSKDSGSFSYSIINARPFVRTKATTQADWITISNNSFTNIDYTITENDSGAQRSGIIKLTYGGYATAEFVVTQEKKP